MLFDDEDGPTRSALVTFIAGKRRTYGTPGRCLGLVLMAV